MYLYVETLVAGKEGDFVSVSIYSEIRKAFQENNELPYQFQVLSESGKGEVNRVLWSVSSLSNEEKERLAFKTIKRIKSHIEDNKPDITLLLYLKEKPLCDYMYIFIDLLRFHIEGGYFDLDEIYNFGIRLATQSIYDSLVKLGILILGNFENDYTKKVMMTLGYHSEFTMYVLEATYRFSDYYSISEELLKNTDGYGKLCAAIKYRPVTFEQKKYVVENLVEQVLFTKRETALFIVTNTLLEDYFKIMEITRENFTSISYLIAYSFYETSFEKFRISRTLVEKYIFSANKYAKNYIDFAAVLAIKSGLEIEKEDSDSFVYENGWSKDIEKSILENCNKIMDKFAFENKILEELTENQYFNVEEASLMMYILQEYQYYYGKTVSESIFTIIFSRVPFYFDLIDYFLIDNGLKYYKTIYDLIIEVIPKNALDSYRDIGEADSRYLPDVWLVYLLQSFKDARDYNEEFFIKCLYARFKDVRIKAAIVLKYFKDEWSEEVIKTLKEAVEDEPDYDLKNYLNKMIEKFDKENSEEDFEEDTKDNVIKVDFEDFDV